MGAKLTFPQGETPSGRTYIVTGGNTGIGYETSKFIAAHGGQVIIACRSEEKATAAIEKMQREHRNEKGKTSANTADEDTIGATASKETDSLNVEFMKLDLSSLASTMEFINAYKAKGYPLHVLICNAGIAYVPYGVTSDGFESMFQVNYLSHFLIILHLLPHLRSSVPNSRIVMVSSIAHRGGSFNLDDIQGKQSYNRINFYNHSKLYQVMSMYALNRRLQNSGIGVFSLHPGVVETGILTNNWSDSKVLVPMVHGFMRLFRLYRSAYQGAATTLVAALDPSYDGTSALYFDSCKPTEPVTLSKNVEKQEALWKYSLQCLKDYISDDVLEGLEAGIETGDSSVTVKLTSASVQNNQSDSNEVDNRLNAASGDADQAKEP